MKKILFITVLAAIFAACESNEPKEFKIKDSDMISIPESKTVANSQAMKSKSVNQLSGLDVVKLTKDLSFRDTRGDVWFRTFSNEQKDTISADPKLLMWATDVISLDGNLQLDLGNFIEAKDVVFRTYEISNTTYDTIAYIPNAVLRAAEIEIRKAYAEQDIDKCYQVFNDAYKFIPITGEQWRMLKTSGNN